MTDVGTSVQDDAWPPRVAFYLFIYLWGEDNPFSAVGVQLARGRQKVLHIFDSQLGATE